MEGYRYQATTARGFVQQVILYVGHGYVYYVTGWVPSGKDPLAVDRKLIERYGIAIDKGQRYRRKRRGLANVQYIRFADRFLMLATPGEHDWFRHEESVIRDVRQRPICIGGYSICLRRGNYLKKEAGETQAKLDGRWRVRVLIARKRWRQVRHEVLAVARQRTATELSAMFYQLPFEPYAPIRKQLLALRRQVNRERRLVGFEPVPVTAIRYRQQKVKPFEPVPGSALSPLAVS